MQKDKQAIIDEITAHILKRGGVYSDWYIGTSEGARRQLFGAHAVKPKSDRWIHRRAESAEAAREVQSYFVSTFSMQGVGEPDPGMMVYAYCKSDHTNP